MFSPSYKSDSVSYSKGIYEKEERSLSLSLFFIVILGLLNTLLSQNILLRTSHLLLVQIEKSVQNL
jgi:hypothetical protein